MTWFSLAFAVGAAGVLILPQLPPSAALALLAMTGLLLGRRQPLFASLLAGFAWTAFAATQQLAGDWPCARDREQVELEAIVVAPATWHSGRVEFDAQAATPAIAGIGTARLRLSWYEPEATPMPGQRWRLTARLRCRDGMSNAGAPDRELELLRQRVAGTGYLVSTAAPMLISDEPWRHPVQRLRATIAAGIDAALPGRASAGVLQGLSVGVRGSVPDALWEAFAATGIAHLMAISGLHVTACALFALSLLRLAWKLPVIRPSRARIAIEMSVVVVVTIGYTAIAGASLPALRTLTMVGIVAWQRALRRVVPVHATLALAALLLIAADPLAMTSPGFWLSFVATAALLTLLESRGWPRQLMAFLRSQAVVFVLLAPVLTATFGRVSLIAPLMNAAAIPLFSFLLLPLVLLATGLTLTAPDTATGLWRALAGPLDAAWPWLETAGRLPGATWSPAAQALPLVVAALLLAFGSLLVPLRGLRLAAAAALIGLLLGRSERPAENAWTLTVLDVGQGLSVVVRTRDHVLVFDTGPRWRGGFAAARVSLLPWLRAAGIHRVDRMIVSHDDADHSGGAGLVRDAFPVGRIITGPDAAVAGASGICRRGDGWRWNGVEFRVLHPPAAADGSDNDKSCALMVTGRGGSALLLADPEAAAEASLLAQQPAADIVLVPHHGSRTSSSPGLVAAVGARIGIVSAGNGNRWGLPDARVVARWRAAGTTVLNTADTGGVTVRIGKQPGAIDVEASRRDARRWWQRRPRA